MTRNHRLTYPYCLKNNKYLMEKITEYLIKPTLSEKGIVKVWKETIKLPTYEIGEEEKIPSFWKSAFIKEVQE